MRITEQHENCALEIRAEICKRLEEPSCEETPYASIIAKHFPSEETQLDRIENGIKRILYGDCTQG